MGNALDVPVHMELAIHEVAVAQGSTQADASFSRLEARVTVALSPPDRLNLQDSGFAAICRARKIVATLGGRCSLELRLFAQGRLIPELRASRTSIRG